LLRDTGGNWLVSARKGLRHMKLSRVAVLGVAAAAGLIAMVLALNLTAPAPKPTVATVKQVETNTEKVLVAARDLQIGTTLTSGDVVWRDWPKDSLSGQFVTGGSQTSESVVVGAVARAGFYAGEPISEAKLIRTDRGFMSAILPQGKRAVALKIAADTSAGGFILPNDHVDVIMTRKIEQNASNANAPQYLTETILNNVRVLAIDQTIDKSTKKDGSGGDTVIGQTATLELTPEQAKIITVAQQMSDRLTLALRSVADSSPSAPGTGKDAVNLIGGNNAEGTVTVVRNGVAKQITGVH
jgi:pilus assembly protein CpaB